MEVKRSVDSIDGSQMIKDEGQFADRKGYWNSCSTAQFLKKATWWVEFLKSEYHNFEFYVEGYIESWIWYRGFVLIYMQNSNQI